MCVIRMLVRCFRRWTIIRHCIFSFKHFIFIIFIHWFLVWDTMRNSLMSLLFCVLSDGLMISLRWHRIRRLTLVHGRSFWNHTFSVFFICWMRCRVHGFYLSLFVGFSLCVVLSKIRPNSHRFVVWLSCFLSSSVLLRKRWLLRFLSTSLRCGRRQRARLISISSILSFILAWLLILTLNLGQHIPRIMSLSPPLFLFQPLSYLLRALIARLWQSIG